MILDAKDWAISEFAGTPGLDLRLQRRVISTVTSLAERPQGSLPQRLDWSELKAAYRLIDRLSQKPDDIQIPHRQRTRERILATKTPVLLIHDQTVLTYTDHTAVADQLGIINDSKARGFIQHNSLAVDVDGGHLLGLFHQQTFCREPQPKDETRNKRYSRPNRESDTWIHAVNSLGSMPKKACWVHVGDRAADFFGLMATVRSTGGHFCIRLVQNRAVTAPVEKPEDLKREDYTKKLMDQVRQVKAKATKELTIGSRGGRPGRTAELSLGSVRLTIRAPQAEPRWRSEAPLVITVVRIWETNAPAGVEPLEWILGTDLADDSPEALLKYCNWYEWRWATMEEYHKVQKTGLGLEDLRFETKARLQAAISLLSVVAVRVLSLRWYRDACGSKLVKNVASEEEVKALKALSPQQRVRSVKDFVDGVAKLGGWLGRKCDGPPGWAAIWRGYQRLADVLLGIDIAEQLKLCLLPKAKKSG